MSSSPRARQRASRPGWVAVLVALAVLGSSRVGCAALLTDFANSYAEYQSQMVAAADFNRNQKVDGEDWLTWQQGMGRVNESNNVHGDANLDHLVSTLDLDLWNAEFANPVSAIPDSVAFKLYFDPQGIIDGQTTVVLESTTFLGNRFALGSGNGLIARDPRYNFNVVESLQIIGSNLRYEAQVRFTLKSGFDPPEGPVTLFGYQVQDLLTTAPVTLVGTGFQFNGTDFITVQNPDNSITTFNESQLQDVATPLKTPLVLDVNTVTGTMFIRNPAEQFVNVTYYEILSDAGSLDAANWVSFDDGEGLPPGMGWDEVGGAGDHALAESNLTASFQFGGQASEYLGAVFRTTGVTTHDLRFNYVSPGGRLVYGIVNYNATSLVAVPEPLGRLIFLIGAPAPSAIGAAAATERSQLP